MMYYKLDIASRSMTTITANIMKSNAILLHNNNHKAILLADVKLYCNQHYTLPDTSFLILANSNYSNILQKALPSLISEQTDLIIFIPISMSNSKVKLQKQAAQLNDFIFSDVFKNIFSYTQLN